MRFNRQFLSSAVLALCASVALAGTPIPGAGPGGGVRYASDAYPGFDNESEIVSPERKEPRWFSFINGPNRGNAADQYAYCEGLIAEGNYSKARKQLDALVREWPTSPEAPKAQQMLAEIWLTKLDDCVESFAEYRYLLDFYSLSCDYAAMADRLYQVAGIMKQEGKEVMFVRFANTVDVRRAFETCVLRAPGAKWVPEAMLTIAALREDEQKYEEAIKVYENLRNLHPQSAEAKTAVAREAEARMKVLNACGYNDARVRDTIEFLKLALRSCRPDDAERVGALLVEASAHLERDAYQSAKFYDSTTRTRRSAISAYEKFLKDYPDGVHAETVRARIAELKEGEK